MLKGNNGTFQYTDVRCLRSSCFLRRGVGGWKGFFLCAVVCAPNTTLTHQSNDLRYHSPASYFRRWFSTFSHWIKTFYDFKGGFFVLRLFFWWGWRRRMWDGFYRRNVCGMFLKVLKIHFTTMSFNGILRFHFKGWDGWRCFFMESKRLNSKRRRLSRFSLSISRIILSGILSANNIVEDAGCKF